MTSQAARASGVVAENQGQAGFCIRALGTFWCILRIGVEAAPSPPPPDLHAPDERDAKEEGADRGHGGKDGVARVPRWIFSEPPTLPARSITGETLLDETLRMMEADKGREREDGYPHWGDLLNAHRASPVRTDVLKAIPHDLTHGTRPRPKLCVYSVLYAGTAPLLNWRGFAAASPEAFFCRSAVGVPAHVPETVSTPRTLCPSHGRNPVGLLRRVRALYLQLQPSSACPRSFSAGSRSPNSARGGRRSPREWATHMQFARASCDFIPAPVSECLFFISRVAGPWTFIDDSACARRFTCALGVGIRDAAYIPPQCCGCDLLCGGDESKGTISICGARALTRRSWPASSAPRVAWSLGICFWSPGLANRIANGALRTQKLNFVHLIRRWCSGCRSFAHPFQGALANIGAYAVKRARCADYGMG
ncbi:hypothetical protein B0H16DRAFT_1463010 [Mycena metata]|uniref:Uncharacterized protein n=1 Tax=Mycena metata TaxID=1033252 RepID=A0AAD7IMR4_9AGAR|nr:hypothetical protein B0H16DRAFT_1463010 [Mycena metata]